MCGATYMYEDYPCRSRIKLAWLRRSNAATCSSAAFTYSTSNHYLARPPHSPSVRTSDRSESVRGSPSWCRCTNAYRSDYAGFERFQSCWPGLVRIHHTCTVSDQVPPWMLHPHHLALSRKSLTEKAASFLLTWLHLIGSTLSVLLAESDVRVSINLNLTITNIESRKYISIIYVCSYSFKKTNIFYNRCKKDKTCLTRSLIFTIKFYLWIVQKTSWFFMERFCAHVACEGVHIFFKYFEI
jgi:hypothetical protein